MGSTDREVIDGEHNIIRSRLLLSDRLPAYGHITVSLSVSSARSRRAHDSLRSHQVVSLLLRLLARCLEHLNFHVCFV